MHQKQDGSGDCDSNYFNLLSISVIKTMTKSTSGRKGFLWPALPSHGPSLREAKEGINAERRAGA